MTEYDADALSAVADTEDTVAEPVIVVSAEPAKPKQVILSKVGQTPRVWDGLRPLEWWTRHGWTVGS